LVRFSATNARAAGHAGARRRPAGIRHRDPVEVLADLSVHPTNLPAAGEVHHDAAVGELLEGVAVARAAYAAPDFLRHRAVTVPVVEFFRHRPVAVVDDEIALCIEILGAHAYRRAREAMAATIERDRKRHLRRLRHLARGVGPLVPRRLRPGNGTFACSNSVLFTYGPVTVSCVIIP
jgi:hypothetical protein